MMAVFVDPVTPGTATADICTIGMHFHRLQNVVNAILEYLDYSKFYNNIQLYETITTYLVASLWSLYNM